LLAGVIGANAVAALDAVDLQQIATHLGSGDCAERKDFRFDASKADGDLVAHRPRPGETNTTQVRSDRCAATRQAKGAGHNEVPGFMNCDAVQGGAVHLGFFQPV
jgi:hypothetical protein